MSSSREDQQQWQRWNAMGVDPGATYYSELEYHTEILARWKERQQSLSQKQPVPTSQEE
ncbi:MAG: hypothetical protein R3C11_22825 [Planctomycetaceae bacterium]